MRLLPAVLALVMVLGAASTAADCEAALRGFLHLRLAVLVDPLAAREAYCAIPEAHQKSCTLSLFRGQGNALQTACSAPWTAGSQRYFTVRLRCQLPIWAGSRTMPLLEAQLFR